MRKLTLAAALLLAATAPAAAADAEAKAPAKREPETRIAARLELKPDMRPGGSQAQVRLLLTCVKDCPVFIDTYHSKSPDGNRPFTLVHFDIWDEKGRKVAPPTSPFPEFLGFQPHEAFELWNFSVFGIDFDLGRPLWDYPFPPGRYRIRATLWLPVRSFVEKREDLIAAFSRMYRLSRERVLASMAEGVVSSNELTIEVR